jgi:hypothetical protein
VKKNLTLFFVFISLICYSQKNKIQLDIEPFVNVGANRWTREIDYSLYRAVDPNDPLLSSTGIEVIKRPSFNYGLGLGINFTLNKVKLGCSYSFDTFSKNFSDTNLPSESTNASFNNYQVKVGLIVMDNNQFQMTPFLNLGLSQFNNQSFARINVGIQLGYKIGKNLNINFSPNLSYLKSGLYGTQRDTIFGLHSNVGISYQLL